MLRAHVAALMAALLGPADLVAQPAYRLGPDTLRYRQQIEVRLGLRAGDSVAVVLNEVDADLAVVLRAEGRGWYEGLRLRQTMPGPVINAPATAAAVGRPYVFSFSPSGRTTVYQAPRVPPEVTEIYDVRFQFDDFFITLPAEPLAPGVTWADTIVTVRLDYNDLRLRLENTRRYRVERDTLVGTQRAVIIQVIGSGRISMTAPGVASVGSVNGQADAEETGYVVMSADGARMLSRHRLGVAQGTLTTREGGREMVVATRAEYRSVVALRYQ